MPAGMKVVPHRSAACRGRAAQQRAPRGLRWWLAASLLIGLAPTLAAENDRSREYEVKAAFLFSFTKYIEWPAAHPAREDGSIGIGLFCDRPLQAQLNEIVLGRHVNGRPVEVRLLARPEEARQEHLVFVCAGDERRLGEILRAVQGAAVVVVGESSHFWEAGGMIELVQVEDQIRFRIDMAAMERANLKVSSHLQKLALAVKRNGGGR